MCPQRQNVFSLQRVTNSWDATSRSFIYIFPTDLWDNTWHLVLSIHPSIHRLHPRHQKISVYRWFVCVCCTGLRELSDCQITQGCGINLLAFLCRLGSFFFFLIVRVGKRPACVCTHQHKCILHTALFFQLRISYFLPVFQSFPLILSSIPTNALNL